MNSPVSGGTMPKLPIYSGQCFEKTDSRFDAVEKSIQRKIFVRTMIALIHSGVGNQEAGLAKNVGKNKIRAAGADAGENDRFPPIDLPQNSSDYFKGWMIDGGT